MNLCEAHEKTLVIHPSADCPLCKAEKTLKDAQGEIGKAMGILQELKEAVDRAEVKPD